MMMIISTDDRPARDYRDYRETDWGNGIRHQFFDSIAPNLLASGVMFDLCRACLTQTAWVWSQSFWPGTSSSTTTCHKESETPRIDTMHCIKSIYDDGPVPIIYDLFQHILPTRRDSGLRRPFTSRQQPCSHPSVGSLAFTFS